MKLTLSLGNTSSFDLTFKVLIFLVLALDFGTSFTDDEKKEVMKMVFEDEKRRCATFTGVINEKDMQHAMEYLIYLLESGRKFDPDCSHRLFPTKEKWLQRLKLGLKVMAECCKMVRDEKGIIVGKNPLEYTSEFKCDSAKAEGHMVEFWKSGGGAPVEGKSFASSITGNSSWVGVALILSLALTQAQ